MAMKVPESQVLPKSIWTSVINAFSKQKLPTQPIVTILKEEMSDTSNQPGTPTMKVRCKTCHRRIKPSFERSSCHNKECPIPVQDRDEILTFKDWKDPQANFKVIEELECSDNSSTYSIQFDPAFEKHWNKYGWN